MPYSHHSHSGQFCAHAKNTLREVINTASARNMSIFAMTEHMPRGNDDLYPEEISNDCNEERLTRKFDAYIEEANLIRREFEAQKQESGKGEGLHLLVGFEAEWIRPEDSTRRVRELCNKYEFDFFTGSVHHVRSIPVDYDRAMYERAREACGGTEDALFMDYFDSQLEMLQALKPKIVGHFDLIRLLSDKPDAHWQEVGDGKVWAKILRNLHYVAQYGGLLELNSAALRKGLKEPYPRGEICQAFRAMGGQFVMSDDSHGIDHVATNYTGLLQFIQRTGLTSVVYLKKQNGKVETRVVEFRDLEAHAFWNT